MKNLLSFASNIRLNTLLSCSAAVLLSAGGSAMAMTTTPATTYNYYVSPTGSDSAAGTKYAPFRTLARAACLIVRAPHAPPALAGELVEILPLA